MSAAVSHHLLIAGTGRAGTSFLVRYLAGVGLETHLDVHGADQWFEEANAGFEDLPTEESETRLPYVLKSPWLCEIIDQVLDNPAIQIDAVILPMRDLVEAASSRVVLERQAMYRKQATAQSWESWAYTPGGVVFSLNPLDQGRLLAVWFHRIVERLTKADIPIVFLAFPRFAEDAGYLFQKLKNYLPTAITSKQAQSIHGKLADASKIRMGKELRKGQAAGGSPSTEALPIAYPERDELNRIAAQREVTRLSHALNASDARLAGAEAEIVNLQNQLAARTGQMADLETELGAARPLIEQREAILKSRSWRFTQSLRSFRETIRRLQSTDQ